MKALTCAKKSHSFVMASRAIENLGLSVSTTIFHGAGRYGRVGRHADSVVREIEAHGYRVSREKKTEHGREIEYVKATIKFVDTPEEMAKILAANSEFIRQTKFDSAEEILEHFSSDEIQDFYDDLERCDLIRSTIKSKR